MQKEEITVKTIVTISQKGLLKTLFLLRKGCSIYLYEIFDNRKINIMYINFSKFEMELSVNLIKAKIGKCQR